MKTPKTLLTNLMKTHFENFGFWAMDFGRFENVLCPAVQHPKFSRLEYFSLPAWLLLFLEVRCSEFHFHKQLQSHLGSLCLAI